MPGVNFGFSYVVVYECFFDCSRAKQGFNSGAGSSFHCLFSFVQRPELRDRGVPDIPFTYVVGRVSFCWVFRRFRLELLGLRLRCLFLLGVWGEGTIWW